MIVKYYFICRLNILAKRFEHIFSEPTHQHLIKVSNSTILKIEIGKACLPLALSPQDPSVTIPVHATAYLFSASNSDSSSLMRVSILAIAFFPPEQ